MLRATEQEQKGAAGVNEVKGRFERIGWGAIENTQHDVGTDLILVARDSRLYEPGTMVIAQVKAGSRSGESMRWRRGPARSKAFANPVRDPSTGAVVGWHFYVSAEHAQAWLTHQLAALLVLHDLDNQVSYWVQVTNETVERTRKSARILVPLANTVDDAHLDDLLEVASSKADRFAWEGTAWAGAANLPQSSRLRFALLAPRLVAPHPNRGIIGSLDGDQAVAMVVRGRLRDLYEAAQRQPDIPLLADVGPDHEWEWQLAAAIADLRTHGTHDRIDALAETAEGPQQRAAATAVRAACAIEDGLAQAAAQLTSDAIEPDDLEPVDHGWLCLQHARACAEIGLLDEAQAAASEAVRLKVAHPEDLTASAIAGAAAGFLFDISDHSNEDLGAALAGGDTALAWWRQQEMSWGLSALADQHFAHWTRNLSTTMWTEDPVWRHLRTSSLLAGFLGDHNAWRATYGQISESGLSQTDHHAEHGLVAGYLSGLIWAGEAKSAEKAARRLVRDGPAHAVQAVANELDPSQATRTAARAIIAVLTVAGSLLTPERADFITRWCLAILAGDTRQEWTTRVRPRFIVDHEILAVLNAALPASSTGVHAKVIDHLLNQPPVDNELIAGRWAQVVEQLPIEAWGDDERARARARVDVDAFPLDYAVLKIAAATNPEPRERLLSEARGGSLDALSALGDISLLELEVVDDVRAHLVVQVRADIEDARTRGTSFGGHSSASALGLLNLWHPHHAPWSPIVELVGEHLADIAGTQDVLARVAERFSEIDDDLATEFARVAQIVAGGPPPPSLFRQVDPRPAARQVLVAFEVRNGLDPLARIAEMVGGTVDDRVAAARAARSIPRGDTVLVLRPLLADPDPRVRAATARTIADFVCASVERATALLPMIAHDPGVSAPRAAAAGLAHGSITLVGEEGKPWRKHPDAQVRILAAKFAPDDPYHL